MMATWPPCAGGSADWGSTHFETEFRGTAADASTTAAERGADEEVPVVAVGATTSLEEIDAAIDQEVADLTALGSGDAAAQVRAARL